MEREREKKEKKRKPDTSKRCFDSIKFGIYFQVLKVKCAKSFIKIEINALRYTGFEL